MDLMFFVITGVSEHGLGKRSWEEFSFWLKRNGEFSEGLRGLGKRSGMWLGSTLLFGHLSLNRFVIIS